MVSWSTHLPRHWSCRAIAEPMNSKWLSSPQGSTLNTTWGWEHMHTDAAQSTSSHWTSPGSTRGTPVPISCTNINWPFPTPIIISLAQQLILTDSHRSRCAWGGQPVPGLLHSPWSSSIAIVITRDGAQSRPPRDIKVGTLQRFELSLI